MSYEYKIYSLSSEKKEIPYTISKKNMETIIQVFLEESKLDVFGFYKDKNQYWGKSFRKQFYFLLSVEPNKIVLTPEVDEYHYFPAFYKFLTNFIAIYQDKRDF
jgi:hypothetical protein